MRSAGRLVYLFVAVAAACTAGGCLSFGARSGSSVTVVEGVLQNEFGRPVRGAVLVIAGQTGRTGQDGHFRFQGVPAGPQVLAVRGEGYLGRELNLTVVAGRVNRVTDPGGKDPVIRTVHSLGTVADGAEQAARTKDAAPHAAPCETCHVAKGDLNANPALLRTDQQALCQTGCHTAPDGGPWEHPAAHLDSTRVQPLDDGRLRLSAYSAITCLRCHRGHVQHGGGSLTPSFPAAPSTASYTSYCESCHNPGQPGNQYDRASHNPGSACLAGCHLTNGLSKTPHAGCARPEAGCHPASATLPLAAPHRNLTGGCAACHDLGGSQPNLLRSAANTLCGQAGCHAVATPPQAQHAAAGCDACHAVHGTSATPDGKCLASCHPAVRDERQAAMSTHDVACATCHHGHVVTASQKVTNPFTGAAYPYEFLTSGAFCLLCHGLGPDYLGMQEILGGATPVEKWPGALNIVPEYLNFRTRVTTFWIGVRVGGLTAPWQDTNMNGHYPHWGDEYVPNPPPGWPYTDNYGNPELPDPCLLCHGAHAGQDPKLVRPVSSPYADWTLYRADHQYDCHYACHEPDAGLAARHRGAARPDRSIAGALAKREKSPLVRRPAAP